MIPRPIFSRPLLGLLFLLHALSLSGCAEEVSLDNAGLACLSPTPEWPDIGQRFESGQPIYVVIQLDTCLSSSCDTEPYASCSVTVLGDRLVIESTAGYTDERGYGSSCTDDCLILEALCQTNGPIADGTYTVVYGDAELPGFTIPNLTGDHCVPRNIR